MRVKSIIWFHLLILIGLFSLNLFKIFNLSIFHSFTYGDSEVAGFIAYLLGKGARLYQNFSIIYGPGRFITLAIVNKFFGVDFSIPLFFSYGVLIAQVLVPWAIYWVSYKLLDKSNLYLRLFLAITAATFYNFILRSGQDTHLIILLFVGFYAWSKQNNNKLISIFAGLLLGLIGFFRIESEIIALAATIIVELTNRKKQQINYLFYISYLLFQIFYVLILLFDGSVLNFFHDVIQMGIIAQPKLMKIAIQTVDYPLFEFFIILNIFAVVIAKIDNHKPFLLLSILNLLGFANALGRADFDHLYYGIVLFIPTILIAFYKLVINRKQIFLEKISLKVVGLTILLIILEVFIVKKQITYLLLVLVFCILIGDKLLKKGMLSVSVILAIISLHTMIRSQSLFTFYFKKQLEISTIKNISLGYKQVPLFLNEVKKGNYGGFQLDDKNTQTLSEIKKDLNGKTLFIYPSNVSLYEALSKKPPIRYLYFNNEFTKKMEDETIQMLSNKKIEYVLVSNELTKTDAIVPNQTQRIQKFINENYAEEKEYIFNDDKMMLMKINLSKKFRTT